MVRAFWRRGFLLAALFFTFPSAASPADLAADLAVRNNQVVRELQQLQANDDLTANTALALIQGQISPIMNFPRITQLALGKHWRRADEQQRAVITAAFRVSLERTYAKVLARYSNQAVDIVDAKQQADGKIMVRMAVHGGGKRVRIDYIYGGEKVEDVKVEGVSLIANYRRQFSQIIRQSGVAGLVAKLELLVGK